MRRQGKAKALIYRWKAGPAADAEISLPNDAMVIAIEDLMDAFGKAVDEFLKAIEADVDLAELVNHNRRELLCYKPSEPITIYVAA